MKSISLISAISSAILCASLIACGDDDTSDKKDSGTTIEQDSGAGGAQQQDSGAGGTSGTACDRICENTLKAACPNTTLEDCMKQCNDTFSKATGTCTAEIDAVVKCMSSEPFTCDDNGKAAEPASCMDLKMAAFKCALGGNN